MCAWQIVVCVHHVTNARMCVFVCLCITFRNGVFEGMRDLGERCAEGYVWSMDLRACIMNGGEGRYVEPEVSCPAGCFVASTTLLTCDCIEESYPESACDPDYVPESAIEAGPLGKGLGKRSSFKTTSAKHDVFSKHDDCVKIVTTPARLVCPIPYAELEHGKCVARTTTPAKQICEVPKARLEGDLCVLEEVIPAKHRCPPGFEIQDGRYSDEIETEMDADFVPLRMLQHASPSPFAHFNSPSQYDVSSRYDVPSPYGVNISAPARMLVGGRRGRSVETAAAEFHHGAHTLHQHHHSVCISTSSCDPTAQCPNGYRLSHSHGMKPLCLKDIFELPITECPPGYAVCAHTGIAVCTLTRMHTHCTHICTHISTHAHTCAHTYAHTYAHA